MKKVLVFPGQGAQYPGMGKDFYENFSEAREVFEQADDILGFSLSKLMFNGPMEELTKTKNSQLAIFVMSMAIYKVLGEPKADICAGLSLGEYSALVAAKKLTFEEGLKLVAARGAFMDEACVANPGTMAVVLGLDEADVADAIKNLEGVWIANLNCPKQVVIAGTKQGIASAEEPIKAKGAKRVLPLEVAGAFHSKLMAPAQEKLKSHIENANFLSSDTQVVMNTVGDFVSDSSEMRQNLIDQVVSSVRWEKGIRAIEAQGPCEYLEIGPGKTLSGMNKKIGIEGTCKNVEKVEDLDAAHA